MTGDTALETDEIPKQEEDLLARVEQSLAAASAAKSANKSSKIGQSRRVDAGLAAQGIQIDAAARFAPWLVMLPHLHGTDGFFGAVLERRA